MSVRSLFIKIESLVCQITSLFANVGYKMEFKKYQLSLTFANDHFLSIACNERTGSIFDTGSTRNTPMPSPGVTVLHRSFVFDFQDSFHFFKVCWLVCLS